MYHGQSLTRPVDYSIHYFEPHNLLIAHMRYIGNDFEKDMEGIKESEATRRWWKVSRASCTSLKIASSDEQGSGEMRGRGKADHSQMTDGMQESFVPGATGSESGPGWWTSAEEVFRLEG
jgi:hypothetical protein